MRTFVLAEYAGYPPLATGIERDRHKSNGKRLSKGVWT